MRRYPDRPVVGVGAVIVDGARIVLIRRASEPLKGEWSLPGGAVEVGETLAEAIMREVREETGLDVRVGPVVDVLDRVHREPDGRVEFHYVLVDFLCTAIGGSLTPASDAADARWVEVGELEVYGVAQTATTVIAKALRIGHEGRERQEGQEGR
jgi:8-oxo-dGTP diphosphatase